MKISIGKALVLFWVVMFTALINCPAHATDVSGIIDTDTIWDLAGSPYIVTGGVLVESGATLTIEAGVEVLFDGYYDLNVQGNIRTLGSEGNEILFSSNLSTKGSGDWALIRLDRNVGSELVGMIIEYATIGIHVYQGSDNKINNNIFRYNEDHAIRTQDSDNLTINNNYIYDCLGAGGSVYLLDWGVSVIFTNNTIENALVGITICAYQNATNTTTINNVNFLGISNYAVQLGCNQIGVIDGRHNYWGPETTAEMDLKGASANIDKIGDFYDNPQLPRVDYAEWLSAPNPDAYPWMGQTPVNQSPVAKAGSDQVVFDTVTLDGSLSYDPDGSVVSYNWLLEYIDDATHDMTASGVNPTITDLYSGFYNVYLTVTDDEGATSTDTSIVAVAGPCVCTASTMYIESIVASTVRGSKGNSYGEVTVTIFDDYGKPVAGATVICTFSGDFYEVGSGVTDGNGVAVIRTIEQVKKPLYEFCVDSVDKESFVYVPEDDIETCKSN